MRDSAAKRRDDGTLEETTPNGAKNRTSSIKQHLSTRTNCRELYSDNVFSILSRGRCALHLAVLAMSTEFVSMKEDRDDTILSLKLEVQELKREIKELRQQHIAHISVPQPNMGRKSYSTVTSGTVPTTTTRVQSAN